MMLNNMAAILAVRTLLHGKDKLNCNFPDFMGAQFPSAPA